jgi:hypothetical protein
MKLIAAYDILLGHVYVSYRYSQVGFVRYVASAVIMIFSSQLLATAVRILMSSWLLHVERKTLLLRTA